MSTVIEADAPVEAPMLALTVRHKKLVAQDIALFELAPQAGQNLPPFEPGAHVVVVTPSGLTRRYSLCNAPTQCDAYVIAVKRDAKGDGGSISMVDGLAVGGQVSVSQPENYFPLSGEGKSYVLIAGGIGITPILSMMHALLARKVDFKLIYCSRSPETTAFIEELAAPELAGRVLIHHDYGDSQKSLDLSPLLAERAGDAHLYCCGPRPLMSAVRKMTRHWTSSAVHFEDFGTSEPPPQQAADKPFSVRLARQGITVLVPAGVSILEALRGRGLTVPSSCESGTCGSCRIGLLSGIAEHRDFVLDEDDHDKEIMICVSRAKSGDLELDL